MKLGKRKKKKNKKHNGSHCRLLEHLFLVCSDNEILTSDNNKNKDEARGNLGYTREKEKKRKENPEASRWYETIQNLRNSWLI